MSRNSHRDNIIFVDPDENENDYWWPALVRLVSFLTFISLHIMTLTL